MKGRKPTPIEKRIAEGNPRHHPVPQPVLLGGRPTEVELSPPEFLPDEAKEVWESVVPTLYAAGVLDRVDWPGLEAMCLQMARARQASEVIARQGILSRGSQGQVIEHPAVTTERNAHLSFLRFAEHYGLTPVARTRLGLAELERRKAKTELDARLGTSHVGAVTVED